MEKLSPKHSFIKVDSKKSLTLDGVINIEGFDDSQVFIMSDSGKIVIEGDGLKIESLTKDDGVAVISGNISGFYYSKESVKAGFFKQLFG